MVPNKFEENLKEKLENRAIQPSSEAWNTLQNRLDTSTSKGKGRPIFWIGLAASIVGILFVVSQFFDDSRIEQAKPSIVVNPEVVNKKDIDPVVVQETENTKVSTKKENQKKNDEFNSMVESVKSESINKEIKTDIALSNDPISKEDTIKAPELNTEKLNFENHKIQEVIAQVQILKDNNVAISDIDLERLLQQAQKDIKTNKRYEEQTGMVNASSLLQDVEADLDRSFRDKVFKALKENFNSITTAVANRNN